MLGQFTDVRLDVFALRGWQAVVIDDVILWDVTEREVDPSSFKIRCVQAWDQARFFLDPLDPVEQLFFEPVATEDLQRTVLQPLLQDNLALRLFSFGRNKLEQSFFSQ